MTTRIYNSITPTDNPRNTLAAEQGAIILTCCVDKHSEWNRQKELPSGRAYVYEKSDVKTDCFEMSAGDIVVTRRGTSNLNRNEIVSLPLNRGVAQLVDSPLVISSLNGFSVDTTKFGGNVEAAREDFVNRFFLEYRMVGVALREWKNSSDDLSMPVQVGGVITIRNSGVDLIKKFEFCRPIVPFPKQLSKFPAVQGTNGDRYTRIPFMMEPIRADKSYIQPDDIKKFNARPPRSEAVATVRERAIASLAVLLNENAGNGYGEGVFDEIIGDPEKMTALTRMLVAFFSLGEEVRNSARFIALSTVKPGAEGDFLLRQ